MRKTGSFIKYGSVEIAGEADVTELLDAFSELMKRHGYPAMQEAFAERTKTKDIDALEKELEDFLFSGQETDEQKDEKEETESDSEVKKPSPWEKGVVENTQ